MKKIAVSSIAVLIASSLTLGNVFAFSDLDDGNREAITALEARGVISGVDSEHFAPKGKLTYAQTVQLLVKGLDLNMDNLRFIKQPLASDIYTTIDDNAWYAEAFLIAHYNGVELPKDVNPNATITREHFGYLLVQALEHKVQLPLVKMFILIQDESQITTEYQGALQRLLLYKIAQLDKDGNFNPKLEMTRGEAAVWLHNTIRLMDEHTEKPAPAPEETATVTVDKVSDDVNKVTLTRQVPHPGYGIEITGIRFDGERAVVTYKLRQPDPDKSYAMVITDAKAVTYVSSAYKEVVAEQTAN